MSEPADRLYFKLLVVRCQVRDPAAFAELVAHCQPRLRAFLGKMLSCGHNVDDVAQDVWMDVFRDLHRLTNPSAFVPWMYRIARHRAFRLLRKRSHPTVTLENDTAVLSAAEVDDFGPEDVAAVHAALGQLIPEHREVLLLRFIEQMSYDDMAQVIDIPLGTVRSRLHNARRMLRQIIERQTEPRTHL
jgi:RNA polymerase sigma-70 factor (ECF subfamily)